jgi:hypothetical protein
MGIEHDPRSRNDRRPSPAGVHVPPYAHAHDALDGYGAEPAGSTRRLPQQRGKP